jgi:hypothetical protein
LEGDNSAHEFAFSEPSLQFARTQRSPLARECVRTIEKTTKNNKKTRDSTRPEVAKEECEQNELVKVWKLHKSVWEDNDRKRKRNQENTETEKVRKSTRTQSEVVKKCDHQKEKPHE